MEHCDKKMNHISVMLGVSKSLGLGVFLAGSTALFAQNPVVPQGSEFALVGNIPGDQVLPSLSLLPSVGVIEMASCQSSC